MEKYYYLINLAVPIASIIGAFYVIKYKVKELTEQFAEMQRKNDKQTETMGEVQSDVRNINTILDMREREASRTSEEMSRIVDMLGKVLLDIREIKTQMKAESERSG